MTEEWRERVREIVARVSPPERIARLDEAETFDEDLHRALTEAGVLRLGPEADPRPPSHAAQTAVLEELGASATSMAVALVVQYMGVQLLASYATEEQARRHAVPLGAGSALMSFALSEPDGGTDVARVMTTRAEPLPGGGFRLSGRKRWIGAAMDADFLILLARSGEPEPSAVDGITMFLLPRSTPGISTRVVDTMGIRGLAQTEILLDGVEVGPEAVLGEVGRGFRQVLATLNQERLNAAAVALGIARGAQSCALDWARQRQAFGRPIGAFQALQHALVDSQLRIESARALLAEAVAAADGSDQPSETLSALAKLAASEAATTATDVGMRVMGGWGYARELPMQRYFRDARLYTFAPITDEMVRNQLGERMLGLPRSF